MDQFPRPSFLSGLILVGPARQGSSGEQTGTTYNELASCQAECASQVGQHGPDVGSALLVLDAEAMF